MTSKGTLLCCLFALTGCAGTTSSFVHSDTTLGRVVVYRNGVAYFERSARVEGDTLHLSVPADKVDDFLKSLTVVDAKTGEPAPIAYPTNSPPSDTGLIDMQIHLPGPSPHELKLTYVTEAPSWKPSYRVVLGEKGKVSIQAWAIVDNTSGEDWQGVRLGVGASSALSFRFDLASVRIVQRETLQQNDLFAQAPPSGGSTYGAVKDERRVLADLPESALAYAAPVQPPPMSSPPPAPQMTSGKRAGRPSGDAGGAPREEKLRTASGVGSVGGRGAPRPPSIQAAPGGSTTQMPQPDGSSEAQRAAVAGLQAAARRIQASKSPVVIEGFADKNDGDKFASSLDRANRVRDQLIRSGVAPEQVVAVGKGEAEGRKAGVRLVEAPAPPQDASKSADGPTAEEPPTSTEPIGISHFESTTPMTVPRGTSAMVSILKADADGEVVYLYDAESPRGNAAFPFRSVRIKNPTDSNLESGPVTVFGEGRFIGEGLSEPIPAHQVAFVPFALDRQIVVERKEAERDEISRILTVQRGVFSTEVQHTRRSSLTLTNRLDQKAVVYIRHTVPKGYKLTRAPLAPEHLGDAQLFRIEVDAGSKVEVNIEEATPVFKTTDIRSDEGMGLVKVFLNAQSTDPSLKSAVGELVKAQQEIGNLEQQIATTRDQMNEYRARMDELHVQLVTLRAVKASGQNLLSHLEKKLQEVSEKLSRATIDLVALQEKLMVARIRFQDGVAELSLEKKGEPPPAAPAAPVRTM